MQDREAVVGGSPLHSGEGWGRLKEKVGLRIKRKVCMRVEQFGAYRPGMWKVPPFGEESSLCWRLYFGYVRMP